VVRDVTIASAFPALDAQQAQHEDRDAERLTQMGDDGLDLYPPRNLDGKRPDGPEIYVVPGH